VAIVDPRAVFVLVDNTDVAPAAAEAGQHLFRIIEAAGSREAF